MSDRVVPGWAHWLLLLGIFLPAGGFFFLKDYSSTQGVWQNVMTQDVVVPFLRGQNPLDCFNESLRLMTAGPLGYDVRRSQVCLLPTELPYRHLLFVSIVLFVLGIYGYINPEQISNKWPTEWKVFNSDNVRKAPRGKPPRLKNESPQEKPIKPDEGGF